jgi:serine/threonine protein kinase
MFSYDLFMTMTHKNPYSIDACRVCGTPPKNGAVEGICTQCMLLAGLASERGGSRGATASMSEADAVREKSPRFKPPSLQEIAAEFPNLEVIEVAGIGGMGVVYKVIQRELGRVVALKILPSEIASEPSFAARFSQEARALAMLSHPNVVHLYDAGESRNFYFLLMEYVDGINLREAIREGNLKPEEALSIVPQVCEALQFAHSNGIVHRDIKPENVLFDCRGHESRRLRACETC